MKTHVVMYRDDSLEPNEAPFAFVCEADGADHAERQCENAYPGADIVWVYEGEHIEDAYSEYWDISEPDITDKGTNHDH